ncbi:MAG: 4Fe-4S binding protein [Endomicrobiia bacterium]|nr:4Fe-4S binding protein [Endomicrobiia bacterium]
MKKLVVDIEKCYACAKCEAGCSYFYHSAPVNNGIERSMAKACQYLVCRRCEEASCIKSCPNKALERNPSGILERHSMLCTSCKSCAMACPFGVIYEDILPFKTSGCDWCAGRTSDDKPPFCVTTCPSRALSWAEVSADDPLKNIYVLNDYLAVHTVVWEKK